ncbi:hypothetical protein [Catellatospora methionotrophica]|uniref:hypothetical protein n=1 Tax=Catellatospora methionotrophica TaxID=121620 RepID=UPI00340E68D9
MYERVVRTRAEWTAGYRRVLEARNHWTSAARFKVLADDEIRPVRLYVARNPMAPAAALARLMADEDDSVVWNALLNPKSPADALVRLAAAEAREFGTRVFLLRHYIACHPNTPVPLQVKLLKSGVCACRPDCYAELYYARSS